MQNLIALVTRANDQTEVTLFNTQAEADHAENVWGAAGPYLEDDLAWSETIPTATPALKAKDHAAPKLPEPKLPKMPLTSFDTVQALAVVWAALEMLDLDDSDSDQINTAMAWIAESLEG